MMIGKDKALALMERVVSRGGADELEATLFSNSTNLTRFANSYIHQNINKDEVALTVRAVTDGSRIGLATTNDLSPEGLERAVEDAVTASRLIPKSERYPGMPGPQEYPEVEAFVERTHRCEPLERAAAVGRIIAAADEHGFDASGAYSTATGEFGLANSHGLRAYHSYTHAAINTTILSETSAGFAAADDKDAAKLDAAAVGRRAVDKAFRGQHPSELEPGAYDIVVEPHGVADLIRTISFMAFNGLAYAEGRSIAAQKLGQKIFGDNFTLVDDAHDPEGKPTPFDFQGMPKQRVVLVENGVFKNVVHDLLSAKLVDGESTGHGLPAGATFGSVPLNLFMAPGSSTLEEMITSTKRGLLVTHFHYINPFLNPLELVFTGMTRDGTFLIEDGKISRPVKNLRFTESMVRAFSRMAAIGADTELITGDFSAIRVPPVKINDFHFTSATDF